MSGVANSNVVIAVDVGGTFLKSGLVRAEGHVRDRARPLPVDNGGSAEAILGTLRDAIMRHAPAIGPQRLIGVALGFPGPSDYARGMSLARHKFSALYGLDVRPLIQGWLDEPTLPVRLRNDAEAAVVGEALYGAGRACHRVIGVTLGTGLGSSFVADGRAQKGGPATPPDGELYVFPFQGAPADDVFSARGLRARFQAAGLAVTEVKEAAEAARAGDAHTQAVFTQFGADLGEFLQPFAAQFSAEKVIVLGGIAKAADLFLSAAQTRLGVLVQVGRLGNRAALLGAAALFFHPA